MIKDIDTNFVYLSAKLKEKQKDFFGRLTSLMDEMGIPWKLLENTNDYWVRDYMPIQLTEKEFLLYQYNPDYLQDPKSKKTITNPKPICDALSINCRTTDIKLDGGNITLCGDYLVMTNKVFTENGKEKTDVKFIKQLEDLLGHEIIIIPWHCIEPNDKDADVYGHSDGFIHWCGGNKVLMSNHREMDSEEAGDIKQAIESKGFNVTEMLFDVEQPNDKLNWAYINYLQVSNKIILPSFGIEEDKQALKYVQQANPSCEIKQIRMRDIANNGGALHCVTWNIKV